LICACFLYLQDTNVGGHDSALWQQMRQLNAAQKSLERKIETSHDKLAHQMAKLREVLLPLIHQQTLATEQLATEQL